MEEILEVFLNFLLSKDAIEECNLLDVGFDGYPFTWSNGRQREARIQCRIDRAFARFGSDLAMISMDLEYSVDDDQLKLPHVIRFEKCWADDDRCEAMVRSSWNGGAGCVSNLETIQSLDYEFKEYRT